MIKCIYEIGEDMDNKYLSVTALTRYIKYKLECKGDIR